MAENKTFKTRPDEADALKDRIKKLEDEKKILEKKAMGAPDPNSLEARAITPWNIHLQVQRTGFTKEQQQAIVDKVRGVKQ